MATCLNASLVQKQSIIDFVFERRNEKRNPEVATQPLFFGKISEVNIRYICASYRNK